MSWSKTSFSHLLSLLKLRNTRMKTDHAALSFYFHWHCPLATHPGQRSPVCQRQRTHVDYFNIWWLCYRQIKPQEGLLSGPSQGHVDSHYSCWDGYPSSFTHITSIRPICVSHLKGFNSISFILWKSGGDDEGREKWVFTCRWGKNLFFLSNLEAYLQRCESEAAFWDYIQLVSSLQHISSLFYT